MNLYLGQTVHSVEKGRLSADDQSIGAKSSPKQQWTSGLVDLLAEVRHGGAKFCDFDGEIRGSLVFIIWISEKVM